MTNGSGIKTLGRFRLLRVVGGADGAGIVYEAVARGDAELVAVRVLPWNPAARRADTLERIRDGVRVAGELRHPNIVPVRDFGCEDRTLFVATDLVDGETLPQFIARAGRLPALQGLAFAAQLLSALECAHRRGLVHTAVHPAHLLVARNGHLKVDGFGWMAAAMPGARPGPFDAPAYLAPELAAGAQADARADVYSAAVVAYELLAGRLPFDMQPPASGERAGPLPVADSRPQLPAELDAVFQRALAPDPNDRHASAAEFGEALGAAFGRPLWVRPILAAGPAPVQVPDLPAFAHARVDGDVPPEVEGTAHGAWARRAALAVAVGLAACVVWLGSLLHEGSPDGPTEVKADDHRVEFREPAVATPQPVATVPAPASTEAKPATAPPPASPAASTLVAVEPPRREPQRAADVDVPAPATRTMGAAPAPRASPAADDDERPAVKRVARSQETAPRRPVAREVRSSHAVTPAALDCRADGMAGEMCMVLRCATAEFRRHPICTRLHAEARSRHQLTEARVAP